MTWFRVFMSHDETGVGIEHMHEGEEPAKFFHHDLDDHLVRRYWAAHMLWLAVQDDVREACGQEREDYWKL